MISDVENCWLRIHNQGPSKGIFIDSITGTSIYVNKMMKGIHGVYAQNFNRPSKHWFYKRSIYLTGWWEIEQVGMHVIRELLELQEKLKDFEGREYFEGDHPLTLYL